MYSPDTSPYVWGLTSSRRREDLRWANTPAWIEWERWHKSPPADTPAPHPRTHTCPKSVRGHIWMCNQDKWMLVSARAYPVSVREMLHMLCFPLQKPKAHCRWRWSGSWKTPFEANQPVCCRLFSGTNGHKNKHKAQSGCTRHRCQWRGAAVSRRKVCNQDGRTHWDVTVVVCESLFWFLTASSMASSCLKFYLREEELTLSLGI